MAGRDPRAPAGSRQVLDPRLWLTGKIESTPHGRSVPSRPGARGQPTQITMNDFQPPVRAAAWRGDTRLHPPALSLAWPRSD